MKFIGGGVIRSRCNAPIPKALDPRLKLRLLVAMIMAAGLQGQRGQRTTVPARAEHGQVQQVVREAGPSGP